MSESQQKRNRGLAIDNAALESMVNGKQAEIDRMREAMLELQTDLRHRELLLRNAVSKAIALKADNERLRALCAERRGRSQE